MLIIVSNVISFSNGGQKNCGYYDLTVR